MTINRITNILVERDGMTPKEAANEYDLALERLRDMLDQEACPYPAHFLMEEFGLEEDYLEDMLADLL